jgi:hypothetical protein
MAEPPSDANSVNVTTGFGSLSLGGKNALEILMFITLIGIAGLDIYENIQRSIEHDQITCQIKLNLFMQAQKPDTFINWRAMPTDLFPCVPKFLYERDSGGLR